SKPRAKSLAEVVPQRTKRRSLSARISGRVQISEPRSRCQRTWPFASQQKSVEPEGTSTLSSPNSDAEHWAGALLGPAPKAFVHATSPPGRKHVAVPELSMKTRTEPELVRRTAGVA